MNDDQLDDEIRALMSAVVAEAPAPKPLPSMDDVAASVESIRRSRGRAVVRTGIAVAASLAALTVFWSSRNDKGSVTAATSSTTESVAAWPDDIAVIVASDRGIERVEAENGEPTITRVTDGETWKAFELDDGSMLYQRAPTGDIVLWATDGATSTLVTADGFTVLDDATLVGGSPDRLRLVYRTDSATPGLFAVNDWAQPDEPRAIDVCCTDTIGFSNFAMLGALMVGEYTDDEGQSGVRAYDSSGEMVNLGGNFMTAVHVATSGSTVALLDADGVLTIVDEGGRSRTVPLTDGRDITALSMRGQALVATYTSGRSVLVDLRDGAVYDVPVANGTMTVSMRSSGSSPAPTTTTASTVVSTTTLPFPEGEVRAVVTQRDSGADDGVWIVTDDQFVRVSDAAEGPAYLARDTLVFSPNSGGVVAMNRTTGAIEALRATGQVVDAAVLGGQLYYLYTDHVAGVFVSLYLHGPSGDTYIAPHEGSDTGHLSWHLGPGVIVGTGAYYSSMRPEFYDFAGNELTELSDEFAPTTQPPLGNRMLYTMNPEGLWGIVDGDVLTLRQWGDPTVLDTITIPDGAQAIDLDVSADRIIVTYNLGTNGADAPREATRDQGIWTWSDLPGAGWATMPRASDPGAPFDVTPLTEPPYLPSVALAGDFGVQLIVGDGTEKVITTDPSERVLLRRDGSISFTSPTFGAYPRGWNPVTGEISEHWAGTNYIAQPILHDDLGGLTGTPFGDFLFSVTDRVYRYSDDRAWTAPGAADTRLSCSYDGWVIGNGVRFGMGDSEPPEWLGASGGEWALTPDGSLAASTTDGLIRVRRTSDGVVVHEQPIGDRVISEIDVSGEWLAYVETPNDTPTADSTSRAVLVHLPSGRSLTYDGAVSVSLANTDL